MRDYMTIIKQYRDLPTHPYIFILTSPPLYMRTVMKEMLWDMQVMLSNLPPRHALTYLLIITTLIYPHTTPYPLCLNPNLLWVTVAITADGRQQHNKLLKNIPPLISSPLCTPFTFLTFHRPLFPHHSRLLLTPNYQKSSQSLPALPTASSWTFLKLWVDRRSFVPNCSSIGQFDETTPSITPSLTSFLTLLTLTYHVIPYLMTRLLSNSLIHSHPPPPLLSHTDRSAPIEPPNDGCHPNDLGYAVMAEAVADALMTHFHIDKSTTNTDKNSNNDRGRDASSDRGERGSSQKSRASSSSSSSLSSTNNNEEENPRRDEGEKVEENEEDIVKDEDTETEVNDNEGQEEEYHEEIQSETKFNGRRRTTATTSISSGSGSGIITSAAVSGEVHTGVGQRPYQKIIVSCVGDSLTFGKDALNPLLLPPLPSTYSDSLIQTYTTLFTLDIPLLPSNHF